MTEDRELDAQVAERVFGQTVRRDVPSRISHEGNVEEFPLVYGDTDPTPGFGWDTESWLQHVKFWRSRESDFDLREPFWEEHGVTVDTNEPYINLHVVPSYSTSLDAAWKVVEHLDLFQDRYEGVLSCGWILHRSGEEWAITYRQGMTMFRAKTAPTVICLAALAVVQGRSHHQRIER